MRRKVREQLYKNRIIACCVGIAVIFFCVLLIFQIISVNNKNKDLEARLSRLESQLAEQMERQSELDDAETYVKTQEYIEEKAKSIGYVYPDEIIFKEEN